MLSDNAHLSDLTALDHPLQMLELTMRRNPSLTSLAGLGQISGLQNLMFVQNGLTSLAPLAPTELNDLWLAEHNLAGLGALKDLTTVTHDLILGGSSPTTFEDLKNLERVENELVIVGEQTGLDGLTGLTVARHLRVEGSALTSLEGPQLRNMLSITVAGNEDLAKITMLEGVGTVYGDVTISGNPSLGDEAAGALVDTIGEDNIGGTVTIGDNGP